MSRRTAPRHRRALTLSRHLLFGVSAADPATYVVGALVLAAGCLLAAMGPAVWLARVNPSRALLD